MQTLTFSQRKLNSINTASKTILAGGRCLNGAGFGWFLLSRQPLQNRVPGNACERLRWRIQRAGVGAAVEKIEESGSPKIFSGTARGVAKQFRALLPLPLENPRNPSNCKGFGDFPFCQKSSKCSKICRKIAAKVVQILYMRGEIVGNSAAGKKAANPAIPTVYSVFSFRPPGEPVGKKHGKP